MIEPEAQPKAESKVEPIPGLGILMELFDIGRGVAIGVISGTVLIVVSAVAYFFYSAPATTITITTGPEKSVFQKNAQKYANILARNGVKLRVLTSEGSLDNLKRLTDSASKVDVGMVQGGISREGMDDLVSLGSISYQPLLVFYRGSALNLLSELRGKRVAIGPIGSGTRTFALTLLAANGIQEKGDTSLLSWEPKETYQALLDRKLDAAFLMSEDASPEILHNLLRSDDIHLFHFKQAVAYSRKNDYLKVLSLPEGSLDFGKNIPPHDITLLGPTVELIAKSGLHPALSDLLLEAATEVHGKPTLFQHRSEFPAPIEHAIPISEDATRFYKSGKSFLYRYLPFWIASLTSRIIVVFIPILVILIPALKSIPSFFRWRTQSKIHRRYRDLLIVEQALLTETSSQNVETLRRRFDEIEEAVNKMGVPASFADQFYGLRGHIDFVRQLAAKKIVPE